MNSSRAIKFLLLSLLLIAGVSFTKHMFISTQTSLPPSVNTATYSRVLAPAQTSNASYALGCIREKIPEESRVKPARMMLSLPSPLIGPNSRATIG